MNREKESIIAKDIIISAMRLEKIANKLVFEPIGLTATGFKILKMLEAKGELTPSQIMSVFGSTKSNITQRLNFLQKNNYILKKGGLITDKRKIFIKLTAEGEEKIKEVSVQMQRKNLFLDNYFTKSERKDFALLFEKLNKIIGKCETELNFIL